MTPVFSTCLRHVLRLLALPWCLLLMADPAHAATPVVAIAVAPLGSAGARVPPNVLLNLALDETAAAAAYAGDQHYRSERDYIGYFDHHSCYSYPLKSHPGSQLMEPTLTTASGYFFVAAATDAAHECDGTTFSGNFLNWASMSMLDIVRYALTGGDRVIDTTTTTVLQRAYLPERAPNGDFYAHPRYFPRKSLAGSSSAPQRVTPFDTPLLYVVSCRNRLLFSDSADGGDCDSARIVGAPPRLAHSDKYFGEYLARVQVCSKTEGPLRPGLCGAYGKSYKPAGAVQTESGRMRVGLFSYLTAFGANDPNQYGGALRAPLAYLGATRYDAPDFLAASNALAEWKLSSGVLNGAAGVINTINQLGRAAPARSGAYRSAAPLSELYYEALRYLQGRQPSPAAAGVAVDDGLPVVIPWTDPVQAQCQRNVVVTLANAGAQQDRYVPGNTARNQLDPARGRDTFGTLPAFDVMDWTGKVGALEADAGGTFGNRTPRPALAGLALQNTGQDGLGSYYLAGLAYWAHTTPIRPGQTVYTDNYVVDLDLDGNGTADDSSPRAIRPRDSQLYLAAKYGGFSDANSDGNPFQTGAGGVAPALRSDTEWSADGRDPRHYVLAGGAAGTVDAIRTALAEAGSVASVVPGTALAATGGGAARYLFRTDLLADGSGRLTRLAVGTDRLGQLQIGAPLWEAGRLLSGDGADLAPSPPAAERAIYTMKQPGDTTASTIPLLWSALSEQQRALLDVPPGADAAADGLGPQRLAYLRGERSGESGRGGTFRRRDGLLGGSVHNTPLFVGPPSRDVQGDGYRAFFERHAARRPAVYLGGGDGMLHGFDAEDGHELFAYVPNVLLERVNQLTTASPVRPLLFDGSAGSGEALLQGQWKSVLVSGLGGGAQGVLALDVTRPGQFADGSGALWEFTDADDAAIGNVLAAPLVAKFRTGVSSGALQYRYFAVVASGLNNYADDGAGRHTSTAAGALFLLALDKPASAPWDQGSNYYKLSTPVSTTSAANGLGPPALVIGGDGAVRYAYAGDLQGNLWRFDFSGKPPWSGAVGPGAGKQPLFVARDEEGQRQPITQAPRIVYAPGGGYLLLFGTGRWIAAADALPASFQPQSFYAVHDTLANPALLVSGRKLLAPRVLRGPPGASAGFAVDGDDFVYTGPRAKHGWYMDFPDPAASGERSVSGAVLAGGRILFNTVVPGTDVCLAAGSRSYGVDALTGLAFNAGGAALSGYKTGAPAADAVLAPPLLFDMAATAGPRDATGASSVTRNYTVVNLARNGAQAPAAAATRTVALPEPAGRFSWREVANWPDLHAATKK